MAMDYKIDENLVYMITIGLLAGIGFGMLYLFYHFAQALL